MSSGGIGGPQGPEDDPSQQAGQGEPQGLGQPGAWGPGQGQPGGWGSGQGQPGGWGQGQGQPGAWGQGQGQPGAWGQPGFYAPPEWQQPRPTNTLAIASLCCAVAQLLLGPFTGIAAIVLGFVSVGQIRRTGEQGRAMAITGIVLGIVGTILVILLILAFVVLVNSMQSQPGHVIPSPP